MLDSTDNIDFDLSENGLNWLLNCGRWILRYDVDDIQISGVHILVDNHNHLLSRRSSQLTLENVHHRMLLLDDSSQCKFLTDLGQILFLNHGLDFDHFRSFDLFFAELGFHELYFVDGWELILNKFLLQIRDFEVREISIFARQTRII